jgi:hypothetical protein
MWKFLGILVEKFDDFRLQLYSSMGLQFSSFSSSALQRDISNAGGVEQECNNVI